jgi:CRP/FNR family transcriptional regulator, anaerobic regulatory protein
MENLKNLVYTFVHPSEKEWQQFASLVQKEQFDKGRIIVKAGTRCERIYYINSGIIRYIVMHQDKEKTVALGMDNDLASDYFGFYSGLPALATLQALTKTELYFFSKGDLEVLYQSSATWERFGRLLAQKGLLDQIIEKLDLQTKTAEQRYLELIERKPGLLEEVNLGIIASCLNITQETLSRIRGRV